MFRMKWDFKTTCFLEGVILLTLDDVASNPFPANGFPIDKLNRLALDRVKSISALSTCSAVKGLNKDKLTTA